jgi:predicted RNase H-like HicB family nuclease
MLRVAIGSDPIAKILYPNTIIFCGIIGVIMSKVLSVILTEEDGGFVALNPDTYVASQGDSVDEALSNLKEALELYFEENSAEVTTNNTLLTTLTI